jgi:hypothetical protein
MKRVLQTCATSLVLIVLTAAATPAWADPGLLLVAHGSPSPEWNKPVLDFGRRVEEEVKKSGRFRAVRTALLESAAPDIPTTVAELEAAGCDRIIAVPLFVAPSGHTHFDVPAVLGIYSSRKTAAVLAEEKAKVARPKVPITVTQTLSESDLLPKYAADQVRKLSQTPGDEAVVILAHGDPEHHLLVERLMRQITTYCCGKQGISYGDWASIGVGQEYLSSGVPAIQAALEHKKRVLVVGIYVSSSAAKIHKRSLASIERRKPGFDPLAGKDVAFSEEPIVNHPEFLRAVVETAHAAISTRPGQP